MGGGGTRSILMYNVREISNHRIGGWVGPVTVGGCHFFGTSPSMVNSKRAKKVASDGVKHQLMQAKEEILQAHHVSRITGTTNISCHTADGICRMIGVQCRTIGGLKRLMAEEHGRSVPQTVIRDSNTWSVLSDDHVIGPLPKDQRMHEFWLEMRAIPDGGQWNPRDTVTPLTDEDIEKGRIAPNRPLQISHDRKTIELKDYTKPRKAVMTDVMKPDTGSYSVSIAVAPHLAHHIDVGLAECVDANHTALVGFTYID